MNHQILLLTLTPKRNRIFRRMCRLTSSKASCREAQPALKMQIKGVWGTPQQAFCSAKVAVVYTTALLAGEMVSLSCPIDCSVFFIVGSQEFFNFFSMNLVSYKVSETVAYCIELFHKPFDIRKLGFR